MRVKLLLDEETESELLLRSNYLGVSLSSTILLHLILYDKLTTLNREELQEFAKNGKHRTLQIDIKEHVIKKYDTKTRYNNSLSLFLSIYVSKVVKLTKTEWKDICSFEKTKMGFSTYSIERDVIKKMNAIKTKTGLTFTTIINYAALIEIEKINQLSLFDESKTKKQQGFQLSTKAITKIHGQALALKISIGNLLEIKLKKALEILDK